jgi:iron complex transport system ATP-binding protein
MMGLGAMDLSVRQLSATLPGGFRLRDVELELPAGTRLGIIGPNGAGKSCLLRALSLLLPSTGGLRVDGRDLRSLSARERARALCLMPQQEEGVSAFPVLDYVQLGRFAHLGLGGRLGAEDHRRVAWALELAGCGAWRERRMGELSGGERQRVRLAAALAQEARILLLDEPAAFLDPGERRRLWDRLGPALRQEGLSLVFVSHDVNEVLRQADRFLALSGGVPVAGGPVEELPAAPWLDQLYGLRLKAVQVPGDPTPWLVERPETPL